MGLNLSSHGWIFYIISHQGNANQSHTEIVLHIYYNGNNQKLG